jgi:hypothetical protein
LDIQGKDDEDKKPLHHYIELMYPEIYHDKPENNTTIEIGMCHVRATDGIRVSYHSKRNGWVIEQASTFSWDCADSECDMDWQEVAFVESWAREINGDLEE